MGGWIVRNNENREFRTHRCKEQPLSVRLKWNPWKIAPHRAEIHTFLRGAMTMVHWLVKWRNHWGRMSMEFAWNVPSDVLGKIPYNRTLWKATHWGAIPVMVPPNCSTPQGRWWVYLGNCRNQALEKTFTLGDRCWRNHMLQELNGWWSCSSQEQDMRKPMSCRISALEKLHNLGIWWESTLEPGREKLPPFLLSLQCPLLTKFNIVPAGKRSKL